MSKLGLLAVASAILAAGPDSAEAQASTAVEFTSPAAGAVLQGTVEIRGTVSAVSFLSAELGFSYADDPTGSWFTINEISDPVEGARLAVWDTILISDGNYILKLRRNGLDGTVNEAQVAVQVRNYTSASSVTSPPSHARQPVLQIDTPGFLPAPATPARMVSAQPTALPRNGASLAEADVLRAFMRGGLAAAAVLLLTVALILRRRM